jgi:glutathione synthase/RimK-type ligase-like ATP-grasp enzyme
MQRGGRVVILLWGLSGDDPLDDVGDELSRCDRSYLRLDQRRVLATQVELDASGIAGRVRAPGLAFALEDVSALFVRSYDARQLESVRDGGAAALDHVHTVESALWCFADLAPIRVLNRPSAMHSNNSKPYQSRLIRAHGFETPETVITTDRDVVLDFWQRHRAVIYKSISGQRSIVARLTSAQLDRLDDIRWCPTQIQEYVAGTDYRVHVVGDAVFATEVISSADDYRYAARQGSDVEYRACELPADVAQRCIDVSRGLELPLAGLDLRKTVDGRWYCFEANPSPCFTFYESHTQQRMTSAVASYLAGHQ